MRSTRRAILTATSALLPAALLPNFAYAQAHDPALPNTERDYPIIAETAVKATRWLHRSFGGQMARAIQGTNIPLALAYAVVCQESAYAWATAQSSEPGFTTAPIDRIEDPQTILRCCVLDTHGDQPGTTRCVFPRNRQDFSDAFGEEVTALLVAEGNYMRRTLHGWTERRWLFKGYGLFQYDLQFAARLGANNMPTLDADRRAIPNDLAFFAERRWHTFEGCADRFVREMSAAIRQYPNSLKAAAARYNGSLRVTKSGMNLATWYGENVVGFYMPICQTTLASL